MKIALSRAAQQELTDTFGYYEQEQNGLGRRFRSTRLSMHANSSRNYHMRGIRSTRHSDAAYCATFPTA